MPTKTWEGTPPTICQVCGCSIAREQSSKGVFVDGRARHVSIWAFMCSDCHAKHGVGIGTGKGQKYQWNARHEAFVKIGG